MKRAITVTIFLWVLLMPPIYSGDRDQALLLSTGFEPEKQDPGQATPGNDQAYDRLFDDGQTSFPTIHPRQPLGDFSIQYEGGTEHDRFARIAPDPRDPQNHILWFWLREPNVTRKEIPVKGRVQANLYGNKDLTAFTQKVRLRLPTDFAVLKQYKGTFSWLTLFEFWNNAGWVDEGYPFRISVDIVKQESGADGALYFSVHGQTRSTAGGNISWHSVWQEVNRSFEVPLDSWMTVELTVVEGDRENGRFLMNVVMGNGDARTAFDINNFTHHPEDPRPDGFRHANPMKLYTSAKILEYVKRQNKTLQVFWDDLSFRLENKVR